jgi:hypothetical protein
LKARMQLAAVAVLLSSYATAASPPRAVTGDPATLTANDLCQAWAQKPLTQTHVDYQSSVWQEIVRRGMFTAAQTEQIRAGLLEVGMPEYAALCAWGRPRRFAAFQTKPTVFNEYMFRRLSYEAGGAVSFYVYTCNAVITSVQSKRGNRKNLARECNSARIK